MKKTLVLGASTNPSRYSNIAMNRLVADGHKAIPLGVKKGSVAGVEIINDRPMIEGIDTITLYLNPKRQVDYYEYILALRPNRIIFNPGTENVELSKLAREAGIKTEIACTLVLLSTDNY